MTNAPVFAKMPKKYVQTKLNFSKKTMTAIAKKVVHGEAETKSAITATSQTLLNDLVYAQNLNFFISQGDTSETLDCEKLFIKNIYIRGLLLNSSNATNGQGDQCFRVQIVKTKKALTNVFSAITASDVYRGATTFFAMQGFVDLHKVDLLYEKTFRIGIPEQANVDQNIPFTINLKVNKNHYFDFDNGGYFKDKNYYFIITPYKSAAAGGLSVATLRMQWAINFKDT